MTELVEALSEVGGEQQVSGEEMEDIIRGAMENNFAGFEVLFQPIISTSQGDMCGSEALLRLHEFRRVYLPGEFLPVAEKAGLISEIDEFVLRTAAVQCRKIHDLGFGEFFMTVNIDSEQVGEKDLLQRIDHIVKVSGASPENMALSVAEGCFAAKNREVKQFCGKAAEMGYKRVIDDCGRNTEKPEDISALPFDVINISARYMEMIDDAAVEEELKQVIEECHNAGKCACVNGVENRKHYEFCIDANADNMQGFYMFVPGNADCLEQLL